MWGVLYACKGEYTLFSGQRERVRERERAREREKRGRRQVERRG